MNISIPSHDQQFNRAKAIRKKKTGAKQSEANTPNFLAQVLPIPINQHDVQTTQVQILSQVLPPVNPETVVLGPQAPAQHVGHRLDVLQGAIEVVAPQNPPIEAQAGRPRLPINFRTFHNSGQR